MSYADSPAGKSGSAFTFERSPANARKTNLAAGGDSSAKYAKGSPMAASGRRASFDQTSVDNATARNSGRRGSIDGMSGRRGSIDGMSGRRGSIDGMSGRSPALRPAMPSLLEIPEMTNRSGKSQTTPTYRSSRRPSVVERKHMVR